jgi:Ser/Thr protein kinase RdoA (MazF antagonist)
VTQASARAALAAWPGLAGASLAPVTTGLINLTFRVDADTGRYALQRLSPIFGREVHEDIRAVTEHLAARGLVTPRLVPAASGALDVEVDGEVWRLLTWVEGVGLRRLDSPARAEAAGRLLGRFHAALADLERPFAHRRLGVHDTPKHLAALEAALEQHRDHPRHAAVAPLGEAILEAARQLAPLPRTPERVVHGDPKLDNLVFAETGEGRALIDLDTVARMPLPLELGDAFRSWCNRAGEDAAAPRFDLDLFAGAVRGYFAAAGPGLRPEERAAVVPATRTIMLELAARFCRDALEERYFGWDPARFATRGAHQERRAKGQLALARDLADKAETAEATVASA